MSQKKRPAEEQVLVDKSEYTKLKMWEAAAPWFKENMMTLFKDSEEYREYQQFKTTLPLFPKMPEMVALELHPSGHRGELITRVLTAADFPAQYWVREGHLYGGIHAAANDLILWSKPRKQEVRFIQTTPDVEVLEKS